ncbi:MAG: hypothetical protein WAT66_06180 [Actinomycetota bacterium]
MRFGYRITVDCEDVGSRVTVRMRLDDGKLSDVLGVLEGCDDATFEIRVRTGEVQRVTRADVVAAKVVPEAER